MNLRGTTDLRGASCVVTGGAGFIGSNLARCLVAAGARVTVLDNLATGRAENLPRSAELTLVVDDICTTERLPALVADTDYVFHLAAQVGNIKSIECPETDAMTNVVGSVRLYKSCQGSRIKKLVYASSSAIFGEAEEMPIRECHPQKPASFYALSKLTAEKYALMAAELWGVPAVCLRFFNVYGLPMVQNEYSGVIPIFLGRLRDSHPFRIYGDGRQVRDFVHVQDVAQAVMLAAVQAPAGSTYNIGSGVPTTILSLAETLSRLAGVRPEVVYDDFRAGEVRQSLADISKARRELAYEPRYDLERGLTEIWRKEATERHVRS
jgi:UDP-glucose 4-epimerase